MNNKLKYAAGVAVVAAAMGGILWQDCNRLVPERLRPRIGRPCGSGGAVCRPLPLLNDLKCEVTKGEADPQSPTFDLASCGYCGDGIRQVNESERKNDKHKAGEIFADVLGVKKQFVTERSTETQQNCPSDLLCGNHRYERGYVAAKALPDGTKLYMKINERDRASPFYCPGDKKPFEEPEDADDPEETALPYCPPSVLSAAPSYIVSFQSSQTITLLRRFRDLLTSHAAELRDALGNDLSSVTLVVRVKKGGLGEIEKFSANCGESACANNEKPPLQLLPLTLADLRFPEPGPECFWSITLKVSQPADSKNR